jgi:hypothetical protein
MDNRRQATAPVFFMVLLILSGIAYVSGYFVFGHRSGLFMNAGYIREFPSGWLVRIYSPVAKIESYFRGKPVWLITPNNGPLSTTQIPVVG